MKKCHVQKQIPKELSACVGKFDSPRLLYKNHIYHNTGGYIRI